MTYPMQHKIIKPFEYTHSSQTDIRVTMEKNKPRIQEVLSPIVLQYPLVTK